MLSINDNKKSSGLGPTDRVIINKMLSHPNDYIPNKAKIKDLITFIISSYSRSKFIAILATNIFSKASSATEFKIPIILLKFKVLNSTGF